jgi:hypothetical protein
MPIPYLHLDLWYEILGLLDIKDAIAISKASPRFLGRFIESKRAIRFRNTVNSFMRSHAVDFPVGPLSSFICSVSRGSTLEFSGLISWLARRFRPILSSSIVLNTQLFAHLSSIIVLKDRGFVCDSSSLSSWTVEMKAEDESTCSVSWVLLYRASVSGYGALYFHQACDGMGKCVVIVKAENGKIAAAYNEDGFTTTAQFSVSPNLNGFIASINVDGECGEIFHRTEHQVGVENRYGAGPVFGGGDIDVFAGRADLFVSSNCNRDTYNWSRLGYSYGDVGNDTTLFGQRYFRVVDYEVYKIVIE